MTRTDLQGFLQDAQSLITRHQLFPPEGEELATILSAVHAVTQPRKKAATPREDQTSIPA